MGYSHVHEQWVQRKEAKALIVRRKEKKKRRRKKECKKRSFLRHVPRIAQ